ncbi:GNAT family N-acetyltransferase [Desulfococcaceae bacterium HSG9]|nr:GNAT family N-acetyltransferase [Desulfococcaceae bacterium HSG9]
MQHTEYKFRPMKRRHVDAVLKIIDAHDDDDFEYARDSYEYSGRSGQYVLMYEDAVIGVTGYRRASDTDNTFWLSWTYLDAEYHGQKLGKYMLDKLLDILKQKKARKLFVSTSDYADYERGNIYLDAIKLYKSMGFNEEIVHPDYYNPGESQLIYGLVLQPPQPAKKRPNEKRGIVLTELFEIDETEDVYAVDWRFSGRKCFTTDEMKRLLDDARERNAHSVFISFPSDVRKVFEPLEASGFQPCGILENYFEDGLHEYQFRCTLR